MIAIRAFSIVVGSAMFGTRLGAPFAIGVTLILAGIEGDEVALSDLRIAGRAMRLRPH